MDPSCYSNILSRLSLVFAGVEDFGEKTETVSHHPAQAMMQVFIQCSISCRKQQFHWKMQKREEETA